MVIALDYNEAELAQLLADRLREERDYCKMPPNYRRLYQLQCPTVELGRT